MKWMGAAAAFVAFQLCVAAGLALNLAFYETPPFMKYAWAAAFPPMLYAGCTAAWHLRRNPEGSAFRHLKEQDWSRHTAFFAAMALMWLQFVSLTWMKAMLPLATSMWADPMLANLEKSLLGVDAWKLLPGPTKLLGYAYSIWSAVVCFAFIGVFFRKGEDRERTLFAFFLTVGILGTFGQYLLPSGGPIFWERMGYGNRFADMVGTEKVNWAADYLWAAYQGHGIDFATGISAFPSIHVATTAWLAIAYRRRWWAWAYLGVIFFGSIILGWHYAIDGVAGAIGALLCYRLARVVLAARLPRLRSATDAETAI